MRSPLALLGALLYCCHVVAANFFWALTDSKNGWDPKTVISFPNSTQFINATERWSIFDPPTYSVEISPATEKDVATAVRVARAHQFPFLATGGRHAISTTLSLLKNGLAIDLSKLNSVSVNAAAATLTVGGGVRFRDIFDPIYAAGFQMPVGASSCVGMLGATLGAGVGREQGIHGLIVDNLLSVRLVTADGKVLEVSETSNSDLFWGVRGSGFNLGIVTSATYKLWPLVNNGEALNADFIIPASRNGSYWELIQGLQVDMPPELGTISIINYNATSAEAEIVANWVYFGPEDEGRKVIAPLLDLDPIISSVSMVPWNKLVTTAILEFDAVACIDGGVRNTHGLNLLNLSASTFTSVFQKMDDYYAADADGRGAIFELEVFSNKQVLATPDSATSYPLRASKGYILMAFGADDLGTRTALDIRSECVATSGFDGLHVYVSYASGDETAEQIWGTEKLPRLAGLKKQWDPDNVFAYNHALPTHYP